MASNTIVQLQGSDNRIDYMNITDALALLNKSLNSHGLSDWTGGLDNSRRRFGLCSIAKKHISISKPLCELNSDDEVRDTILHEIAHALAWQRHNENCGHDERWKAICVEIGARPVACFDNEVVQPAAPWVLVHRETGEIFRSYYKRPKRNWSDVWIRGRKSDTFGMLEIRASTDEPATGSTPESNLPSQPLTRFDPQSVVQFKEKLLAHIDDFVSAHGLSLSDTKGRYSDRQCDITLSFKVPEVDGKDTQRTEFAAIAAAFNLKPEDYHRKFRVNGTEFQLTGLKIKNRKYPVIGIDETGRQFKFELSVLDNLLIDGID